MSRFLSTVGIIFSLIITIQSCNYRGRSSNSNKIENPQKLKEETVANNTAANLDWELKRTESSEPKNLQKNWQNRHQRSRKLRSSLIDSSATQHNNSKVREKENSTAIPTAFSAKTSDFYQRAPNKRVLPRIVTSLIDIIDAVSQNDSEAAVFSDVPTYSERKKSQRLTDTAKILAGMNISDRSNLANFKGLKTWQEHQQFLNDAWWQLETQRLVSMRTWQATELSKLQTLEPIIFFPFNDVNLLDVYTLFPQGKVFIMVGIDPIGKIPDLSMFGRRQLAKELAALRSNLYEILALNYFRPPQEDHSFATEAIAALYVFLVRTNNRIYDVDYVSLNESAEIIPSESKMFSGVKIVFAPEGDTERKTIYYFSSTLSDEALAENPELIEFIGKYTRKITYLDTAAYLLHFDSFSQVRDIILSQSDYILQDDSGLPLTAFQPEQWDLNFYGNYTQPQAHFSDRYQTQLWQIYNEENIQPLNFATGYQSTAEDSNLMLARSKNSFNVYSDRD